MSPVERPICEYGGIGGCARPATHVVCFYGSRRWRLSCDSHKDNWKGEYWVSRMLGWNPDPATLHGD
jgi:hypothetical protein